MGQLSSVVAASLAFLAASPAMADHMIYHNDRFDLSARLPMDFVPDAPPPTNGDGREFISVDGLTSLTIYGSYQITAPLQAEVAERRGLRAMDGDSITYDAQIDPDTYVLSGVQAVDGAIYYVRMISGETCEGDPAYGFYEITYDPSVQSEINPMINWLTSSLAFDPC
ncbi:hypothetical protein [Celeribacter sp. ULVN23_4]